MASWRARLADVYVRAVIRREDWGDERALARRARRLFGAPTLLSGHSLRGLRRQRVDATAAHGEWIVPPDPLPGLVLYVHGGGYVACSPATNRAVSAALARLTRRRVFAVDYRLAPEARFPAAHDDAVAAYLFLLRQEGNASRTSGRAPIAIVGESAGGGLALALAMHARDRGLPMPACIGAFSPWTDLTGALRAVRANDGRCAMFRPRNLPDFAAAYLGGASSRDPRASPRFGSFADFPPTLLQVAATELLLDDAREVHAALGEAGAESTLEVVEGVFHAWHLLAGFVPEADAALARAAAFIDAHLPAGT